MQQFESFLNHRHLDQVTVVHVMEYLSFRSEKQYAQRSTARMISCLRLFYQLRQREGFIEQNPLSTIVQPKLAKTIPKDLSEKQVELLLSAPDQKTAIGQRDKVMLELLYACGLRISELINLTLMQVNLNQGTVQVM